MTQKITTWIQIAKKFDKFTDQLVWLFCRDKKEEVMKEMNWNSTQLKEYVYNLYLGHSLKIVDNLIKDGLVDKSFIDEFLKSVEIEKNESPSPESKEIIQIVNHAAFDILSDYGESIEKLPIFNNNLDKS